MRLLTYKILAWAVLAGYCALPSAQASYLISVTGVGFGVADIPMLLTRPGQSQTAENEFATQILINFGGQQYTTYCVDLFTSIGYGDYNADLLYPQSYPQGERAAWILNTYGPLVNNNEAGAALQLALWDVVHDNGDGLSAGSIQLSSSASTALRDAAAAIVTTSEGQTSLNATIFHNTVIADGSPAQNLITMGIVVPEPSTVFLFGTGLAALAGLKSRSRRSRSISVQ